MSKCSSNKNVIIFLRILTGVAPFLCRSSPFPSSLFSSEEMRAEIQLSYGTPKQICYATPTTWPRHITQLAKPTHPSNFTELSTYQRSKQHLNLVTPNSTSYLHHTPTQQRYTLTYSSYATPQFSDAKLYNLSAPHPDHSYATP
jgi:hypothetical protein